GRCTPGTEDRQAGEADRRRHLVAVAVELVERREADRLDVHRDAVEQLAQVSRGGAEALHRGLDREAGARLRDAVLDTVELCLPERELRARLGRVLRLAGGVVDRTAERVDRREPAAPLAVEEQEGREEARLRAARDLLRRQRGGLRDRAHGRRTC